MKKLLKFVNILLFLILNYNITIAQVCLFEEYITGPDDPGLVPYESKNGWALPTPIINRILK